MRIETAIKRMDSAIMRLSDAYSAARHHGPTHAELLARIAEARAILAGCPRWTVERFTGYERALAAQLYRDALMFGAFVDGRFYSTDSRRPDYYQKHGIQPSAYADGADRRGHYWTTTPEPRPFFVP